MTESGFLSDRPRFQRRSLVIVGLSGAAVAVPLLDLFGKNPEVFVTNRSSTVQILLFGLVAALAVPILGVTLVAIMARIGPRTATVTYYVIVGLLTSGAALVISRQVIPANTAGAAVLALAIAVPVLVFYRKIETGLLFSSILLPAALVMFFVFSPTAELIWASPPEEPRDTGVVGKPAPIVFIQLDELPLASLLTADGAINGDLFPNVARLARSGTWYRNALSTSIYTNQSVPAILSGRRSDSDDAPTDVDHPDNLFTLLRPGYEMHVIEWITDMCTGCEDYAGRAPAHFASLLADSGVLYGHLTLPQAARELLPSIDNSWSGFLGQDGTPTPAPVAVEDFPVPGADDRADWIGWLQRIINGIEEDAPPTLHFVHLRAPHVPWQVNPSGTHYLPPEEYREVDGVAGTGYWAENPAYPRLGFQRHLYQLGFFDEMLGALLERLKETGTWDDALIVLVADHGASFVPGQHRRWPYEDNRDDLYRVPMIIKYPGQSGGETEDRTTFTIDILPTIVDALEIDTGWDFDGLSLLTDFPDDRPHEPVHWCCSREGADTDLEVVFEQAKRNHQWIPDQTSWLGVASVGPSADLVGSRVEDLEVEGDPEVRWSFDQAGALGSVDRESGMVPTMLTGRLEVPAAVETGDLLFSVNGTIAGAGFVIRDSAAGGEIRGLLAEELVAEGENEAMVLIPDPDGSGWLTGSAADVTVEYYTEDGRLLDVHPEGNSRIHVDPLKATDTGWEVQGWAADVVEGEKADRIFIFAGETLVASGPPNRDTESLVGRYDSENLRRAGFVFHVDADDLPANVERLTVIAEFGGYSVGSPATRIPGE